MDTSKEYIKMCEKAKDIHRDYLNQGDFYYNVNRRFDSCAMSFINRNKNIWLPRQDQLQEMVEFEDHVFRFHRIPEGRFKLTENTTGFKKWAESMEQLWLAFVMFKKYNKTWDGEEWIKA